MRVLQIKVTRTINSHQLERPKSTILTSPNAGEDTELQEHLFMRLKNGMHAPKGHWAVSKKKTVHILTT